MNVKELKDMLENYSDTMPVFVSSDEEGNSFEELAAVDRYWMDDDRVCIMDDGDYAHYQLEGGDQYTDSLVLWP